MHPRVPKIHSLKCLLFGHIKHTKAVKAPVCMSNAHTSWQCLTCMAGSILPPYHQTSGILSVFLAQACLVFQNLDQLRMSLFNIPTHHLFFPWYHLTSPVSVHVNLFFTYRHLTLKTTLFHYGSLEICQANVRFCCKEFM